MQFKLVNESHEKELAFGSLIPNCCHGKEILEEYIENPWLARTCKAGRGRSREKKRSFIMWSLRIKDIDRAGVTSLLTGSFSVL